MSEETRAVILLVSGAACGWVNVLAGGGSFLTLGVMMEALGLPAQQANATNRVGILAGGASASLSFAGHGLVKLQTLAGAIAWTAAGGLLGTYLALVVPEEAFKNLLAFLMVAASLWMLKDDPDTPREAPAAGWLVSLGLFGAGVYAGFVQAGVGFLLMALGTRAGLDLLDSAVLKTVTVLVLQTLSLAIFAATGSVDWWVGLWLALGNLAGSLVGVRMAVLKGNRFIRAVVVVSLLVFAVLLLV